MIETRAPAPVRVALDRPDDFDAWRAQARALVAARIPPDHVVWSLAGESAADLFAESSTLDGLPAAPVHPVRASKAFLEVAASAILHSDDGRFALLYRLLWRLQQEPQLMGNAADRDVGRLARMVGHVRRDIHKMRAFVRFRAVRDEDGAERYVAWFEPDHHIVRRNADFFLNRFASQRWSILTPLLSLDWDGERLREGPGARREDAPAEDAAEDLWGRYYASIFNPARLKVAAMVKEMPRRYWKNLPEARLIPGLIAGAQAREAAMVEAGAAPSAEAPPASLEEIARGILSCRRCAIGCNGTRAVAGEGPARAQLMIVGEQPGDQEEQAGRPFVGPAGQLLALHLEQAGLDRARARITNAVRHFKFEPRGKLRLHRNPSADEIDRCRWWLDAERKLVRPSVILALGASAGRAILGRTPSIGKERGLPLPLGDGSLLWLTAHPSYLLRLDGEARIREEQRFRQDLRGLAAHLRERPDGPPER